MHLCPFASLHHGNLAPKHLGILATWCSWWEIPIKYYISMGGGLRSCIFANKILERSLYFNEDENVGEHAWKSNCTSQFGLLIKSMLIWRASKINLQEVDEAFQVVLSVPKGSRHKKIRTKSCKVRGNHNPSKLHQNECPNFLRPYHPGVLQFFS